MSALAIPCGHFASGRCRSCADLATAYPRQLAGKDADCRALLAPFGAIDWLPPVASPVSGFRNKAKMVVSGTAASPVLGILDAAGAGVDLSDCPLYPPALQAAFAPLADFIARAAIAPYDLATRRGELKYLLVTLAAETGELMVRFVLRSRDAVQRIQKHLPSLQAALPALTVASANLQPVHAAVLEGEQELSLTPARHIRMRLNGLTLHLGPRSFFQTNDIVAAALYRRARAWIDEAAPSALWDLFCGVGGFALHCADGRRAVTGIESSAEAIEAARLSARDLGVPGLDFRALDAADFARDAERVPGAVIVNPPRRGIGEALARFLDASPARTVIYSSCNAQSLARDLAGMPGLAPVRAQVLDMFPHTAHYEVLVLLRRQGPS